MEKGDQRFTDRGLAASCTFKKWANGNTRSHLDFV